MLIPRLASTRFRSALAFVLGSIAASSCSCDDDVDGTGANGSGASAGTSNGTSQGGNAGTGQGGNNFTTGTNGQGGEGGITNMGGGNEGCVFVPPSGEFAPGLDCAWNGPSAASPYPLHNDVVMTPVVVNLTDDDGDNDVDLDDIPDIAFVSYRLQEDGCCNSQGVLRVVSGGCNSDGTMTEHLSIGATEIQADIGIANIWLDNSGGLAAADIDGDGSVDLVATTQNGGTIAFEKDGHVKWYQPSYPASATTDHLAGTTPSIADLDKDGLPEIIQGRVVLNGEDGSLAWKGTAGTGTNGFLGPVTSTGDIDLDGELNVLAGSTAYDADGNSLWTFDFLGTPITAANCQASGFPCDGFTATGNFDSDDEGEVLITRAGVLYFVNHDGSPMLDPVTMEPITVAIPANGCARNEGGPPTVADFDGDGQAEVGVAGANFYVVADLECLANPLPPQCSDPGIRWKVANQDCSSRVTGSSVFDFEGDGKAEVIYNDEQFFRIFDGTTGTVLTQIANHSHTRLEMPIIADVDNDGNAEIVFIENASGGTTQGIRVYADANDTWVPTRRIWNQHAYHVTNTNELGQIPQTETPNWLAPSGATVSGVMNNFRQNLPDFDVFAAPDLTVAISFDKTMCPQTLGLVAQVCNEGALQVGAGTVVTFWNNANMTEIACTNAPVATTSPLAPGQCQNVTCQLANPPVSPMTIDVRACVDNGGYACDMPPARGGNNECHEDNNLADGEDGCTDVPQ
ncbi:MAG: VCBS repeat-containing protein [Polyangiaceae bacterium]|nr:VCBS repeat-containing protein [Polyangiaceae bacterium]